MGFTLKILLPVSVLLLGVRIFFQRSESKRSEVKTTISDRPLLIEQACENKAWIYFIRRLKLLSHTLNAISLLLITFQILMNYITHKLGKFYLLLSILFFKNIKQMIKYQDKG